MVARFVRLEFSIRSMAGKLVVDETRLPRPKRSDRAEIDLDSLSPVETLDAIVTAIMRRAIYATPEAPKHYTDSGELLRRVAPLRDVVPVVRSKGRRGSSSGRNDARDWRGTVAQKLQRIPRDQAAALVCAEKLRLELRETRNKLAGAISDAKRLRGSRRKRTHLDSLIEDLRSTERKQRAARREFVESDAYDAGIDNLFAVCTETAEVERECFGESERD
jgi:hypothetical protein